MIALFATSLALATEPAPDEVDPAFPETWDSAVMVSPLGPIVALAINLADIGEFGVPVQAFDQNLRGHHMFTGRWGLTAQVDITGGELLLRGTHYGLRVGPRMTFRKRGVADWAVSPFVLGGLTTLSAGGYPLARWFNFGVGVELGRTFVWRGLAIELGGGLYRSRNFGYAAQADAVLGSEAPEPLAGVLPLITWSVGRAL